MYVIVASVGVLGDKCACETRVLNVTHICRFSEESGKSSVDAIWQAFEMKTAIKFYDSPFRIRKQSKFHFQTQEDVFKMTRRREYGETEKGTSD